MDNWISDVVGKMHVNKISQEELGQKLGCARGYVNMILNGKRSPKGAKERFASAIDEIIKSKLDDTNAYD